MIEMVSSHPGSEYVYISTKDFDIKILKSDVPNLVRALSLSIMTPDERALVPQVERIVEPRMSVEEAIGYCLANAVEY